MRLNKLEPIENWQGFKKYQKANKCFINLEILFIKSILNGMEAIHVYLQKCIKHHEKVSNTKKIDERLRAPILNHLNALLFLNRVFKLRNQDFDKLLNKRILKTTFMNHEKQILKLLKNHEEQILIHYVFQKYYLLFDVKDKEELSDLTNLTDFHQNHLRLLGQKLPFPKNKAFIILENMIFDLVALKAYEVEPLNKLKKLLDLK